MSEIASKGLTGFVACRADLIVVRAVLVENRTSATSGR
jgi:hypothetical protein|tara:strand:+ start:537 stop:650 length:114 start_codon:yes stop_codon:yes gene_type:complete